jgi:hypothetical protein
MNYDFLASMDESVLNRVFGNLFARPSLWNKVMSGDKWIAIGPKNYRIRWETEAAPTVRLNPPSPEQWSKTIKADGVAVTPRDNCFIVTVPKMAIWRTRSDGSVQNTRIPFDIVCWLGMNGTAIGYEVLGVTVDLSKASPFDQEAYEDTLPEVMAMVAEMLGHQYIPNMALHGMKFGSLSIAIDRGRISGAASLEGSPPASRPDNGVLPNRPFFVLLSRKALEQTSAPSIKKAQGTSATTGGVKKADVAEAKYSATIFVDRLDVSFGSDPTTIGGQVEFRAQAEAGVSLFEAIINRIADEIKKAANAVADAFSSY